jgi:hypothetical protein
MNTSFKSFICRFLAIAMVMLPFQTGQASMITTDQVSAPSAAVQLDRDIVVSFLNRADTVDQFQAMGLDTQAATDRVAAMTDDEVRTLAGKVNEAPAGGIIALILVVFFIWYFAFRR